VPFFYDQAVNKALQMFETSVAIYSVTVSYVRRPWIFQSVRPTTTSHFL